MPQFLRLFLHLLTSTMNLLQSILLISILRLSIIYFLYFPQTFIDNIFNYGFLIPIPFRFGSYSPYYSLPAVRKIRGFCLSLLFNQNLSIPTWISPTYIVILIITTIAHSLGLNFFGILNNCIVLCSQLTVLAGKQFCFETVSSLVIGFKSGLIVVEGALPEQDGTNISVSSRWCLRMKKGALLVMVVLVRVIFGVRSCLREGKCFSSISELLLQSIFQTKRLSLSLFSYITSTPILLPIICKPSLIFNTDIQQQNVFD